MSATVYFSDPSNELAVLTATFKLNGVLTNPTTVTLTVTDPTGAVTTPAPVNVSTGLWTASVPVTMDGLWLWKWTGTGTVQQVFEGTFDGTTIASSLYCSVEELKSRLGITDTADDFELTLAVQSASRSVDEITGRYFWRGTDTRTYVPESIWGQELDDIVSVTTLKMDRDGDGVFEESWTQGTDYQLTVGPGQYNSAARGEQWPFTGFNILGPKFVPFTWMWSHQDRIQVNGVFGWPAVPLAVKQSSLILAAEIFKLKDAPFGIAGFGEFGVVKVGPTPQVYAMLQRYISAQRKVGV